MWSTYCHYFQIRKDENYSEAVDTKIVKSIFKSIDGVVANGKLYYKNKKGFPSISIAIVKSKNGNFAIQDKYTYFEEINLIDIQSTKKEVDQEWIMNLMKTIANKLNWEVILETDDDGNEDVVLWEGK
jgi:hypothetical protein